MTNVKNGMNLRYATMWDMPIRYLAAGQLFRTASLVRRAPQLIAVGLITFVVLLNSSSTARSSLRMTSASWSPPISCGPWRLYAARIRAFSIDLTQ